MYLFSAVHRWEEELAPLLDGNQFSSPANNNNNENNSNYHIIDRLLCASHGGRCFAFITSFNYANSNTRQKALLSLFQSRGPEKLSEVTWRLDHIQTLVYPEPAYCIFLFCFLFFFTFYFEMISNLQSYKKKCTENNGMQSDLPVNILPHFRAHTLLLFCLWVESPSFIFRFLHLSDLMISPVCPPCSMPSWNSKL